jgi:imidazolonepropionase
MRDLAIVRDGVMFVQDGRIKAVGSRAEIEPLIGSDCEVIDAGGRVVMPGFVDAHTHPVFAGNRANEFEMRAAGLSYQDIARAGGGIRSTVRLTRAATEQELAGSATRYADWFLRCGTTTVEAKSGYGLSLDDEVKMLRAIRALNAATRLRYVPTFLGAHIVPDECPRDGYVSLIVEQMLPQIAQERLAEFCDVFCEDQAFTVAESERILIAARRLGLGLRIHADQLSPGEGALLAARLGVVTADHLEHTGPEGIAALRSAGVQPVLLPGSVYALGSKRYPAAREMIEAGLAVVLATDFNPGSAPTPSMPMVLSLAVTQMRMTPAEAITASTINAACSLGRGPELGSLEPGKAADFVIHDCADHRELAYFFGIEPAWKTFAAGRPAFERARGGVDCTRR